MFLIARLVRMQLPSLLWLLLSYLILTSCTYFLSNNHPNTLLRMGCIYGLMVGTYKATHCPACWCGRLGVDPVSFTSPAFQPQLPPPMVLFTTNSHLLRRFFIYGIITLLNYIYFPQCSFDPPQNRIISLTIYDMSGGNFRVNFFSWSSLSLQFHIFPSLKWTRAALMSFTHTDIKQDNKYLLMVLMGTLRFPK